MAAACLNPSLLSARSTTIGSQAGHTAPSANINGGMGSTAPALHVSADLIATSPATATRTPTHRPRSITGISAADAEEEKWFPARKTLILSDLRNYDSRAGLWKAQDWTANVQLKAVEHESWPYHDGCATLVPLGLAQLGVGAQDDALRLLMEDRDLVSPLEEQIFYWTKFASKSLKEAAWEDSSNTPFYLLKHISQHWVNQLELINTTISKGEWFADDYQAKIDDKLSLQKWKKDLNDINFIAKDINYMRRHLMHFWRAMIHNLECVGIQLGEEGVDDKASIALKGAQKDFLTIHYRMQPLRDRAEALNSVASDLSNLRAAFRGVHDGEFSVRLSLFASIVFPLTLVASIFSMSDGYLPGTSDFWKLWAIGLPLCLALAMGLVYGRRPWRVFIDGWEYGKFWGKKYGFFLNEQEKKEKDSRKPETKVTRFHTDEQAMVPSTRMRTNARRTTRSTDEEEAVGGAESVRTNERLIQHI